MAGCAALAMVAPVATVAKAAVDQRKIVLVCEVDDPSYQKPDRYAAAQVFPGQEETYVVTGLTQS